MGFHLVGLAQQDLEDTQYVLHAATATGAAALFVAPKRSHVSDGGGSSVSDDSSFVLFVQATPLYLSFGRRRLHTL